MEAERLVLVSGNRTYRLTCAVGSPAAAADPPGANTQPHKAAAADSATLQSVCEFTILGSTPDGETLFIKLAAAHTLESAITQAADALGKVFDDKPTLIQAFAGAQAKGDGGASVSGKLKGRDVRGLIFCQAGPGGGSATVIIAPPDVSKAAMATLFGYMPVPIHLQTHKFPDGSGSIDLPEGWSTPGTSASFGIVAKGPAGQAVVFASTQVMYTPDCRLVRTARQAYQMQLNNYQNALRSYEQMERMRRQNPNLPASRGPQKPAAPAADPNEQWPTLNFCEDCSGAEEVLKKWYPIGEAKARRRGGPYTTLEKVIEVAPADPNPLIAGSKAGLAYLSVTDHDGEKVTHVRTLNRISTAPVVPGDSWQLSFTNMPPMRYSTAICRSWTRS